MKKHALIVYCLISATISSAQCPFPAILKTTGHCVGDTLTVSTASFLSKIIWYNSNAIDTTVNVTNYGYSTAVVAGGNGIGPNLYQVDGAWGLYVDKSGNVFVAEYQNHRVQKWAPGAKAGITVAGGYGYGSAANQLANPAHIWVDANGSVYVSDNYNARIQKWVPGAAAGLTVVGGNGWGKGLNQISGGSEPLYIDAKGFLYVGDGDRVLKFPPNSTSATNGVIVAGGNDTGTALNQLHGALGMCVDGAGNLYVSDEFNCRVMKYKPGSTTGTVVAGGHGLGPAANQISVPGSIFIDANGNLLVEDGFNQRIQIWKPGSDTGITLIGYKPFDSFGFNSTFIDDNGIIYTSAGFSDNVQKYTPDHLIDSVFVPSTNGTYTAMVTDNNGCTVTTNPVIVSNKVADSIHIFSSANNVCADSLISFTATAFNGGTMPTYQWMINGNDVGTNSTIFTNSSFQNGDLVTCQLINTTDCSIPTISNNIAMVVKPTPTVFAGNDTILMRGSSLQFHPAITGAVSTYEWNPTTGLNNPTIPQAVATPSSTIIYQLKVTASNGCAATSDIKIVVTSPIQMPSAFTPNADGTNDVFRIPPAMQQAIAGFSIYNRFGKRIFFTTDSSSCWDGTLNGQKQPAGSYVWEILYNNPATGKSEKASGVVILIR